MAHRDEEMWAAQLITMSHKETTCLGAPLPYNISLVSVRMYTLRAKPVWTCLMTCAALRWHLSRGRLRLLPAQLPRWRCSIANVVEYNDIIDCIVIAAIVSVWQRKNICLVEFCRLLQLYWRHAFCRRFQRNLINDTRGDKSWQDCQKEKNSVAIALHFSSSQSPSTAGPYIQTVEYGAARRADFPRRE